ncbi:hypothetical protein H0H93_008038 [Arthromyces matolae]|nr:hypothetical protein H0H93_008038 [Arthromyces matolae]
MHHCFTIPEIQSQIFANITTEDKPRLRSLLSLTTTCKAFSRPALTLMWNAEPDLDLGILVRTFPEDVWEENYEGILKLVRPLYTTDFHRFDYYASMIRTIHLRMRTLASRRHRESFRAKWIHLDDTVFEAFEDYAVTNRRTSFLPSLSTVTLTLSDGDAFLLKTLPRLHYFLTSEVKSLVITHPHFGSILSDQALVNLVNLVTQSTPNITTLRQDVRWLDDKSRDRYWFGLLQLPYIEKLRGSVHGLSSPTIRRLGELKSLRSLSCIYLDLLDVQGFTTEFGLFPSLRVLKLCDSTDGWESVLSLLTNLRCPFENLNILLEAEAAIHSFSGNLTPVFTRLSGSLTSLTISLSVDMDSYGDLPPTILRSILSLEALQDLAIWMQDSEEFNDDWLAEASKAWPNLRSLSILPIYGDISLRGMIPVVTNCRKLETLRIFFPMIGFEPSILPTDGTASNINIRDTIFLYRGSPQDMDPYILFACITEMFPNVTEVKGVDEFYTDSPGADEVEYRTKWAELERLFQERKVVR